MFCQLFDSKDSGQPCQQYLGFVDLLDNAEKEREKTRTCRNHKPHPLPDIKRKEEETEKTKQAKIKQTYDKH